MPIKPENAALYPGGSIHSPEWLAIREQVRLRAHDLCEECGVVNGSVGIRYEGEFIPISGHRRGDIVGLAAFDYRPMRLMQIVCTVAHVDNALVDHSLDNLRFWCQRCHLNHDRAMRKAGH